MNVSEVMQVIREIRAQVMLHDQGHIKDESKALQDAVREINYKGQKELVQQYQEARRLETECLEALSGVEILSKQSENM